MYSSIGFRRPAISSGPPAEERCPEANQRCPLFDGDFEIVGHAHRESAAGLWRQRLKQRAQAAKIGSDCFWIDPVGRNAHQAPQTRAGDRGDLSGSRLQTIDRQAVFGLGGIDLHLQQNIDGSVDFRCTSREFLRQRLRIDALNQHKLTGHEAGFVALKMPDKMPAQARKSQLRCGYFRQCFLNVVFAEVPNTGSVRFGNTHGGHCFGDSHQRDVGGVASGAFCSAGDLRPDSSNVRSNVRSNILNTILSTILRDFRFHALPATRMRCASVRAEQHAPIINDPTAKNKRKDVSRPNSIWRPGVQRN